MPMAQAQVKTSVFQNGKDGYQGAQDTFVMTGEPDVNANFENHPENRRFELEWDGQDGGGRNLALMKFEDIFGPGEGQVPLGAQILGAKIITTVANAGSSNQSSLIYNLLVEWDQQTATYNSLFDGLGTFESPLEGEHVSSTSVRVFHDPASIGQQWEGEITQLVQEWSDGLPNNGFVIVPEEDSTNGFGHFSSEMPRSEPVTRLTVETSAGVFVFEEGVEGYTGVQDAWIGNENDRYFSNFGDGQAIQLERDAIDDVELGLLRFDSIFGDGAGQIPPGATVQSAKLNLWVQDGGNDVVYINEILPFEADILGVQINTFFDEESVTFENFVEDGVYPQYGVEISEAPVSEFTPEAFSQVEVDVTPSLEKWAADPSLNYGWLLEPSSGEAVGLSSAEGGESGFGPPRLEVTYIAETGIRDYMVY